MKYTHKMVDPYKNIAYGSTTNEEFTLFAFEENKRYPIQVEMIGVTNPDKDYSISRKTPHYFVIEYIESGQGYLEVGGKKYDLSAGDVYILTPGIPHKYGADKLNPCRKIWINCYSGFLNEFLAIYGLADKVVFKNSGCKMPPRIPFIKNSELLITLSYKFPSASYTYNTLVLFSIFITNIFSKNS